MRYIILLFIFFCWSCIPTSKLTRPKLVYHVEEDSSHPLHQTVSADSGETLYMEFRYNVNPAVELTRELKTEHRDIPANVKLSKMKKGGKEVYGTISLSQKAITYLWDENKNGSFDKLMIQSRENTTNWKKIETEAPYHEVEGIRSDTGGVQRELVYRGMKGNLIYLEYLEYRDELTFASRTRKLSFDLDTISDNLLIIEGAKIEILNAAPQVITYRLKRGFTDLQ